MIRAVDFSTFDLPSVLLEEKAAAELHAHGSLAAAVLVPMTRWPERPTLTFTERNADLRKHAGEISFPGGMSDPGDSTLEETALREAEEEVSLSRDDVQVIGALAPVGTFATSFRIQPFVGLIEDEQEMVPSPGEVAAILSFSVEELVENYAMRRLIKRGVPLRTPTFEMGEHMIWGATARVLTDLLVRLQALR